MFVPIDEQFCFKPLRLKKKNGMDYFPLILESYIGLFGCLNLFYKAKSRER